MDDMITHKEKEKNKFKFFIHNILTVYLQFRDKELERNHQLYTFSVDSGTDETILTYFLYIVGLGGVRVFTVEERQYKQGMRDSKEEHRAIELRLGESV